MCEMNRKYLILWGRIGNYGQMFIRALLESMRLIVIKLLSWLLKKLKLRTEKK